jgi:hypothetical protein
MAQFSRSIVVTSAGTVSITPGTPLSFIVTWGSNISPFRWSRIWPAIIGAADVANHQTVTFLSEGSQWDTPSSFSIAATLRGDSDSDVPVEANIQVMASQDDTF